MTPLTSFNAEVKRRSLTIRQSIRDKGRLWIPATVQIGETVTIESPDGTRIIRPLRLAWHEPNKFFLSGVDQRTRTQRVLLRFRTAEEAGRLAVLLKEFSISVEPLPLTPEEIPITVRQLYSKVMILSAAPLVAMGSLLLVGIIFYGGTLGDAASLFAEIIIAWLLAPGILILFYSRTRLQGMLRVEANSVTIRTRRGLDPLPIPDEIIWEDRRSIILRSRGSRTEIVFSSAIDASRARQLLRERYPSIRETNIDVGS